MPRQIYGLFDPRSPEVIRYVGYTKNNPKTRLRDHLSKSPKRKYRRDFWICKLKDEGVEPGLICLEMLSDDADWQERERFWIAFFPPRQLTNTHPGGAGANYPTEATRLTLSQISKRKWGKMTAEQRAEFGRKNGAARLGKKKGPVSEEGLAKLRAGFAKRVYKHSPEALAKITKSNLGNKRGLGHVKTPEVRAQIGATKTGCARITNGTIWRMLRPNQLLPEGWKFVSQKRKSEQQELTL